MAFKLQFGVPSFQQDYSELPSFQKKKLIQKYIFKKFSLFFKFK